MWDSKSTKIIQLLSNHQIEEAVSLWEANQFDEATHSILQYLIYLAQDETQAIQFWDSISMDSIDPLTRLVIEPFNFYLSKDKERLHEWLEVNPASNVMNVVEANNLAFYAHYLQLENQIIYLKRAQQLSIQSELMKPIQQEGEYQLFSPLTLLYIHTQVIQFLQDNFETKEDLDKMIERLKNDQPI